jgi:hypothetical protein
MGKVITCLAARRTPVHWVLYQCADAFPYSETTQDFTLPMLAMVQQ